MKNNELKTEIKYEKTATVLPGIMAVIFALFLVCAAVVTVKCYPIYALFGGFESEMRLMVWTFMSLPGVILPISLLLTNLLGKKYSAGAVILSFVCCLFFVAIRIILSYNNGSEILYILCLCAFYLIFLCFAVGINESFKFYIKNKIANKILPLFFVLIYGAVAATTIYFELGFFSFFTHTILLVALPPLMLGALLAIISLKISGKPIKLTLILCSVIFPYGIIIACFDFSFTGACALVFLGLLVGLFIKFGFDIFAVKPEDK